MFCDYSNKISKNVLASVVTLPKRSVLENVYKLSDQHLQCTKLSDRQFFYQLPSFISAYTKIDLNIGLFDLMTIIET